MVVKRIGVWSLGRMYGALMAGMGLLVGLLIASFSMAGARLAGEMQDAPTWLVPAFGIGALVLAPIFYGIMGLIVGTVTAVLYNIFAGIVGGVVLETD